VVSAQIIEARIELLDSLSETLEILADPEAMADLRRSEEEIARGDTVPLDQVLRELRGGRQD
jgi:PHD/YefM family antitoxin component YafN of YafNO toxin-antitoxin module